MALSPLVAGAVEPARQAPSALPVVAPSSSGTAGSEPAADRLALPRHLTIELRRDGAWIVDGVRFASVNDIEPALFRAARTGLFAGVAVFGEARGESPAWHQLSDMLSRAGLSPIRHAGRATPVDLALSVRATPPAEALRALRATAAAEAERAAEPPAAGALAAASPAEGAPARADVRPVTLSTVGLHVAGAANREENRRKLVAVFERRFDAFRRCYPLAHPHAENASFGVDLLIPAKGGKATLRQTRTRLRGGEFKACMQRVFEAISFDPPPTSRSEIVSYSVLFKPGSN